MEQQVELGLEVQADHHPASNNDDDDDDDDYNASSPNDRQQSIHTSPQITVTDNFLLRQPTSEVRYRGNSVHVYELRSSQIQLVKSGKRQEGQEGVLGLQQTNGNTSNNNDDHAMMDQASPEDIISLEMKDVGVDRAGALSLLRMTYVIVALFFTGIVSRKK
jgi:hypothetical protein